VSLGVASHLLGVSPGTVRRWSDAGRIQVFTTPGGHRRFHRPTLERLLPAGRAPRSSVRSGMTPARLARAYRHELGAASRQLAWIGTLNAEQRDWFRVHGRRMAELLLANLDATDEVAAAHSLREVSAEAAAYGRVAADLGLSLGHAVEGILEFRRPFLHELGLVARRRGFDATETTELIEKAERAMDHLLLAAITAQNVARVGTATGAPARSLDGSGA
jgi:excisionase family DNA binding protein